MKNTWLVIRFSLLVVGVMVLAFGLNVTPASAEVVAKFSPGGTRVTFTSSPPELLIRLRFTYCDSTEGWFSPRPYRGLGSFTYIDTKPIETVTLLTINDGHLSDGEWGTFRTFKRECDNPTPSDLTCKLSQLAPSFHRTTREPISFKSQPTVTDAYLRIPGYDDINISERPAWNSGQRFELALHYNSSNGFWEGEFASMFLPVGEHKDVVLIVRDEFGQQGKCRVGDLTVLP